MSKPIVVVITPAFNADKYLNETIFSVISQRGDFKLRYHIQDGGSSDNTVKILREWEERLVHGNPFGGVDVKLSWTSQKDTGMYDAINRGFNQVLAELGLELTNNPVLTWINTDDILLPNSLNTVVDYFSKNNGSNWVTGVSTLMSESGVLSDTSSNPTGFAQSALLAGEHDGRTLPFVQQEGTYFRYSLWNMVDGVSQKFKLAGDWDLWRRFAAHEELVKLRCVLAVHRRHSGQLSEDMDSYYNEVDNAAPIDCNEILNEGARFAIYKIDTGIWQYYISSSKELRHEILPSKYTPSIGGKIDFSHSQFPSWVQCVSGTSGAESFGRWSDANLASTVRIVFYAPLPKRFQLHLSMRSLGDYEISPVTICVGTSEYKVPVTEQFSEIIVEIDNSSNANSIDLRPNKTISPIELDWSTDERKLALAIEWISVNVVEEISSTYN